MVLSNDKVSTAMTFPGLIKQIHDDMISAGWVKSSADFNDQLFAGKSFGDLSVADLEAFVQIKLFEYECKDQVGDTALYRMRAHLGVLRAM